MPATRNDPDNVLLTFLGLAALAGFLLARRRSRFNPALEVMSPAPEYDAVGA